MPQLEQPTFDGSGEILGFVASLVATEDRAARQENAYPGIDGVEQVFHGARGATVAVTGLLVGATPFDLAVNFEYLNEYLRTGLPAVLTTDLGATYDDAVLVQLTPGEAIRWVIFPIELNNFAAREYKALFRVLTARRPPDDEGEGGGEGDGGDE